jgi:hypothetical protein
MPRCQICALPAAKRAVVERELVAGRSLLSIAQAHNISKDSLWRHKQAHLGRPSPSAEAVSRGQETRELNDRLKHGLKAKLLRRLNEADAKGDTLTFARCARELRQLIEADDRNLEDQGGSIGADAGDALEPRVVILTPELFERWQRESQRDGRVEVVLPMNDREGVE